MTDARPMTEALGQSGASVEVYPTYARKSGDQRVHEQGLWLQIHECAGMVHVHDTALTNLQGIKNAADPTPAGYHYNMERLSPLPFRSIHPRALADEIGFLLGKYVWDKPTEVEINWQAHHEYLMDRVLAYVPEKHEVFMDKFVQVMEWQLAGLIPACLIHGDPTFANTMLRGQQHVLIDPIPASPHVPSLRATDIGKIVQSLLGYETRRFGWYFPLTLVPGEINNWIFGLTDTMEESQACWYFAAFHFLRLLPYTPAEHYDAMTELLHDAVEQFA